MKQVHAKIFIIILYVHSEGCWKTLYDPRRVVAICYIWDMYPRFGALTLCLIQ